MSRTPDATPIDTTALAAAVRDCTPAQITKALALIAGRRIVPSGIRGCWQVTSSAGDDFYMTTLTGCSCPAGRKNQPCYHRAAAAMLTVAGEDA
jgi:hypothetical protein